MGSVVAKNDLVVCKGGQQREELDSKTRNTLAEMQKKETAGQM